MHLPIEHSYGPFLERPGNFFGPKKILKSKPVEFIAAYNSSLRAHKPFNFALLTDTFIESSSKLFSDTSKTHSRHKTAFKA